VTGTNTSTAQGSGFNPGNTSDSDYAGPAGIGAISGLTVSTDGNDGLVVLRW
jgi:hypothetical protein